MLIKSIPRKLTKLLLSPGENNKSKNFHLNLIKTRSKCSLGMAKTVRVEHSVSEEHSAVSPLRLEQSLTNLLYKARQ